MKKGSRHTRESIEQNRKKLLQYWSSPEGRARKKLLSRAAHLRNQILELVLQQVQLEQGSGQGGVGST